ncbi:S24 family peptidase [Prevotella pallens]|uniref:S24 family peptidase n=1 Tax=Prevotella pallens TaxID=60133 RepID=UPI003C741B00
MMRKNEISDRFMKAYEYLVENHITTDKKAFADSVGISSSLMTEIDKGRSAVGVNAIQNIVLKYNISSSWLLTGEGTMLKNDAPPPLEAAVQPIYQPYNPEKKVDNQIINLYDFEATAGLRSLLDNRHANIIDTIKIPNMPKCDGAIHIVGDSMYPRLKPGDIIFYKKLPIDLQSILYGEMYLLSYSIDGDDYCVVKYIKRSDKGEPFITLASHNPAHEDTDIDFRCVNAIALIKGSYNQTTMS